MSPGEPGRGGSRWQVDARLAEELAQGQTLAKAAGCSLATAKRRSADPAFRVRVEMIQEQSRRDRAANVWAWFDAGQRQLPAGLLELMKLVTAERLPPGASAKVQAIALLFRSFAPDELPPAPELPELQEELETRLLRRLSLAELARSLAQEAANPAPEVAARPRGRRAERWAEESPPVPRPSPQEPARASTVPTPEEPAKPAEDPPAVDEPARDQTPAAPEPPAHVAAEPADPPQPEPLQPTATPVVRPMVGFPDEDGRILQPDGSYVRDLRLASARREDPPPAVETPTPQARIAELHRRQVLTDAEVEELRAALLAQRA